MVDRLDLKIRIVYHAYYSQKGLNRLTPASHSFAPVIIAGDSASGPTEGLGLP
jgi:hypothetical protein